jgi:hypothetical protein
MSRLSKMKSGLGQQHSAVKDGDAPRECDE